MKDLKQMKIKRLTEEIKMVTILIQEVSSAYAANNIRLSEEAREGLNCLYEGIHRRIESINSLL